VDEPVRFDAFMRDALYGANGFYTSEDGGRAGRRRGDFLTSPEVGPLFGAVIARALDAWWDELDRPDPFTVVDAGAGPGTLARSILAAGPQCAATMRYIAVEVSAAQRASHPDGVESRASMPDEAIVGVVLANELLDNVPFRLLVFDGAWREAFVVRDGDRYVEITLPISDARPPWLPASAPHGARVPWQAEARAWVEFAQASIERGRVVVVDYASATTFELAHRPWRSWLRTYRGHERGVHYLAEVGRQDITAEVAVDQLPVPDAVRTQVQFLERWGIGELVDEGRRKWAAGAARPDVAAMAMRSRVREAEALLDTAGLGSFLVLEWAR
jgi:SAM-dependent MidA family methyltransferase